MTSAAADGRASTGCAYYDAGACRSCTRIETPYATQLAVKQQRAELALAGVGTAADVEWHDPVASVPWGFRNKAKLVVGGTLAAPTLGILDGDRHGVDLRGCPLYSDSLHALFPLLAELVTRAGLTPYDVNARTGEAKHLLVTEAPDGQVMLRVVLRSRARLDAVGEQLAWLADRAPQVRVVTVNLLPEHKAVLEGETEVVLTDVSWLPMPVGGLPLRLPPRSFFQTNTAVAETLYRQAAGWADDVTPSSVLDLYCGVGGFALHLAGPPSSRRLVHGVEVSADAIAAATAAAADAGLAGSVTFAEGDATAPDAPELLDVDLVVVNPPRRGLGPELCARLETAGAPHLLYSSCHPGSLARDLAALPGYRVQRARLLDMFPHTDHAEVLVLAEHH